MQLKKILELIRDEDLQIRNTNLGKLKGYWCPDINTIFVDKDNCESEEDFRITIAHELLHAIHENWAEEKVEQKAKEVARGKEVTFLIDFFRLKY